jgi:hypothetical protein
MEKEQLFNCCTDLSEPEWSLFEALEIVPMMDNNGESSEAESADTPDFWSIIAHTKQGDFEPITDCTTRAMADCVATVLCGRSGLNLFIKK